MIDVVIPVYRGAQQTRRCIESALATVAPSLGRVVIVNDASPEPAIAGHARQLADSGRVDLVVNDSNQGFVRSVNRGMSRHEDRDVVLLNSDTEVANEWLERLRSAAHRDRDIATATPFSNNATICSYPFDGWGQGVPGTLGLAALDLLCARSNAGRAVDIPTAVGFCMYIRRDALAAIGPFDAERFGRGYGEENDFCMRALKAGWRNVLAADVFVYHEGGVSFSAEREALMRSGAAALRDAHPDYDERVQAFVKADPAQPLRAAIDLARIQSGEEEARHVLMERRDQHAIAASQLREIQTYLAVRETHINELHQALARVTGLALERNASIETLQGALSEAQQIVATQQEEIGKLREGLAHAESLAFGRQKELDRIHALWIWRLLSHLVRRSPRG